MTNHLLFGLTFVSALGCGLTAGVFFAFSVFVMEALASLPPAQGIAAMQSINVTVLNPWFLGTAEYVTDWTTWNHVRTAAALAAAASLTVALCSPSARAAA
jgi:uncharacterized membrane protein